MSEQLKQKITQLETEMAALKKEVNPINSYTPWWEEITGTFANHSVYDEAMQMGKKYRKSLRNQS